jgi:hypothetical protein
MNRPDPSAEAEALVAARAAERPSARVPIALALAAIVALTLTTYISHTLFHTLAEILFVIVGLCVFLVSWTLRRFQDDDFAAFIGVALLAASVLHLVHLVDYPGAGMISSSPDPPAQLWVAATLIQASSFAVAPFALGRRFPLRRLLIGYLLATLFILATIYVWPVFPTTGTQGVLRPS